ncbi:GNAT family N-acetyltransferase [Streptomyces sp. NPDC020719]|uniref:GNAT family N-acetyltransferase n=1 Tax=Streptomyces sp. NPDC020719 TaxID=3154896 RepID=UPI0033CE2A7A
MRNLLSGSGRRVWLPGGERVALRAARARDRAAVSALYALCAPQPQPGRHAACAWLLSPRMGRGLLAEAAGRRPVAWAGLLSDGTGAELLLLIAPAWWRRGLAGVLLPELLGRAGRFGIAEVWAHGASGDALEAAARRLALPVTADADRTGVTLRG